MKPEQKVGGYRILSPLGAGGMGEVWRAEDEKLGREVALKMLPGEFAGDSERMARFEREAKVLASLNHPNIATLFGLETVEADESIVGEGFTPSRETVSSGTGTGTAAESGGDGNSKFIIHNSKLTASAVTFLVMELVEGEDLSERISRGPIPLDEAVPIARQIAEALEAAHERGIVHRDLKPANIKLRPDGTVKVLDFGLAKAWETGSADSSLSLSPTMTQHATAAGLILGTAAYMSPEQAAGTAADQRADIWAFGVVALGDAHRPQALRRRDGLPRAGVGAQGRGRNSTSFLNPRRRDCANSSLAACSASRGGVCRPSATPVSYSRTTNAIRK